MIKQIRLLFTAAVALVVLGAAASSAVAAEATVSAGGAIESSSNGSITFGDGITAISCPLTLNGSLARGPIQLVSGRTFGAITEVRVGSCSGGDVDGILSLPWDLEITTLLGTAPNELTGFSFTITPASFQLGGLFGVQCLYSGSAGGLQSATRTRTAGVYTTGVQTALAEVTLPRRSGGGLCPDEGTFRGSFDISPVQTITVTGS